MEQGIIVKGIGGAYDVQTDLGLVSCTLRGKLRLRDDRVLVGDRVEISREPSGSTGVVETILPRTTELLRPPIANIDQVVVVFAVQNPAPSFLLLDRILVQAELLNLPCVVVFNKGDLDPAQALELAEDYASIPYRTVITTVVKNEGLEELKGVLRGKITALTGPSGAGKSSLLNALDPNFRLETGAVSAKAQRGRHTTRSVELLPLADGYVADTPGFSRLSLDSDQERDLQFAFPDFRPHLDFCQFRGCLHRHEPGCQVKAAVKAGQVSARRYEHYLILLEEAAPRY